MYSKHNAVLEKHLSHGHSLVFEKLKQISEGDVLQRVELGNLIDQMESCQVAEVVKDPGMTSQLSFGVETKSQNQEAEDEVKVIYSMIKSCREVSIELEGLYSLAKVNRLESRNQLM